MGIETNDVVTVLCRKLVINPNEPALQWLIGSPFLPPLTIVSTVRCIHSSNGSSSPDLLKESDDIRVLLPKGFEVIGALKTCVSSDSEAAVGHEAIGVVRELRKLLADGGGPESCATVGAVLESGDGEVRFFVLRSGSSGGVERVGFAGWDDSLPRSVWDRGCLLRCEVPVKFPVYIPVNDPSGVEKMFLNATEAIAAKFKDPQAMYLLERSNEVSSELSPPIIIRGQELDFSTDLRNIKLVDEETLVPGEGDLTCAHFCLQSKSAPGTRSAESADVLQVSVLLNASRQSTKSEAPVAEYFPVEEARLAIADIDLEVLCYADKGLPLKFAISKLIVPALVDQLNSMKGTILSNLLTKQPRLHAYHINPPGWLHPVTAIYELDYGETEQKQVEFRRSLHLRLGLPSDRPLLRIANAMEFSAAKDNSGSNSRRKGALLRDVHHGIPSSGVSGGVVSLVQGSYEYHHYLQDGFDDSGWGCAYRSLQTIISWFRLQYYTPIDVPSHREIQQALVEIGDKDPSFIGSREWIGAIELSFVLDKLLGATCKIINVRSGAELPEKCRELALHFETQGTPIMIGGGVLAYTLLGVDYNEASGDCAFLILDPHYTGTDELKKIVNGGWCGWKKAVDSKGKNFFLHDKFYNLLLPQRPNMV